MTETSFTKLDVWQKAMDLVISIYETTKAFPKEEQYTLTSQIRRSAISIPSNIAEGRAKRTTREYMRFINISAGSAAELETQIRIGEKLGYISAERAKALIAEASIVGRMLNKLYSSLEDRLASGAVPQPLASNS